MRYTITVTCKALQHVSWTISNWKIILVNTHIHRDICIQICVCMYTYPDTVIWIYCNDWVKGSDSFSFFHSWLGSCHIIAHFHLPKLCKKNSSWHLDPFCLCLSFELFFLDRWCYSGEEIFVSPVWKHFSLCRAHLIPSIPSPDCCRCLRATAAGGCNTHCSLRSSQSEALPLAFLYPAV